MNQKNRAQRRREVKFIARKISAYNRRMFEGRWSGLN